MSTQLVRDVRSAVIGFCMANGVGDAKGMRRILSDAKEGLVPMSIAGVKAANTKCQVVARIRYTR